MPASPRNAGRRMALANRPVSIAARPRFARRVFALLLAAGMLFVGSPARAADINILTVTAFKPVLLDLAAGYAARTGNTLAIANDTAGGIAARITRGEEIDLIVAPAATLSGLTAQRKIVADSVTPLARAGIGVVVKKGTPPPDISTVEAFRQTMLAVPSYAYIDPESGGEGGIYLAKLFDKLGIAQAIRGKAVLVPGGLVASRVDNGEAVLGLQRITALLAVRNITFVGPLPAEIQSYVVYAAAIPSSAIRPAAARALLTILREDTVTAALPERGLERP